MKDHWNVLYQVSVFYADRKSKMATTAGHRLTLEKFQPIRAYYWPWQPCWISDWNEKQKFCRGPSKEHSCKDWFQLAQWFRRRRLKCEKFVGYSTWLPGPIICSDWLKFQRSSSLKLMNWLNPNCKRMFIGMSFIKLLFFYADRKSKMAPIAGHILFEYFPIGSNVNLCPVLAAILDFRSA
jgi:hypothetical protein